MREFRRNERLERVNQFQNEVTAEEQARRRQGPYNVWREFNHGDEGTANADPRDTELFSQWRATLVDIGPAAVFDPFVSTTLYSNKNHIRLFTRCKSLIAVAVRS